MFPLGHMGLGLKTASPFRKDLPSRPLLLGTLLPDLIDKPLYYGLSFATGRQGAALGIIAGTRTFGHTILFAASLAAIAATRRSKAMAALVLGAATHLLLDIASDALTSGVRISFRAFFWPVLGWQFPSYAYHGLGDHLAHLREPILLYCELAGAFALLLESRSRRARNGAFFAQ